jgi:hypothetical protein
MLQVGQDDVLERDVLDLPVGVVDVAVRAHQQDGLPGCVPRLHDLVHARHGLVVARWADEQAV